MKNKINFKSAKKILCKLLKTLYKATTKKKGIKIMAIDIGDKVLFEIRATDSMKDFIISKKDIKDIIKALLNLDDKIESITNKLNQIDTENKTQIKKIPLLENQNQSLSNDKQRLESEKEELSENLRNEKSQNDQLKSEKKALTQQIDNLTGENRDLNSKNQDLNSKLTDEKKKKEELSENLRNEKSQNDQLKSEKKALTQQIDNLTGENRDLNSKNQDLNSKLTDEKRKNEKLNKDINTDLFNLYKHLPADFRQNFSYIKADTQMKFIITSGDKHTLINLYEHIKNEAKNNKDISQLSGFFDELFEVQRDIYGLERIEASSEFDESNHTDLGGKSRGKIEKTIFKGFKDGKKPYKSVVKIGE